MKKEGLIADVARLIYTNPFRGLHWIIFCKTRTFSICLLFVEPLCCGCYRLSNIPKKLLRLLPIGLTAPSLGGNTMKFTKLTGKVTGIGIANRVCNLLNGFSGADQ